MRSVLILATLVIATPCAFYVVWMNRASEKIITAVIPISIAALVGVFMAVFVFGGERAETIEFPTTLIYRASDNLPVVMPFRPLSRTIFLVPQLKQSSPELLKDDASGMILYHHFLQRSIVESLALRYGHSWETKILRFETSTGDMLTFGPSGNSPGLQKVIPWSEIEQDLGDNRFAHVHTLFNNGLVVPPDTTLEIQAPRTDPKIGETSSITLDNPFLRVTIQTRVSDCGVLFGGYRLMLGEPNDTNTDLRQANFVITFKKEFKHLRTGHPDMPRYKAWAQQLAEELQAEYDEQRIWAKAKEDYLFSKQLPTAEVPQISVPQVPITNVK
jgi:hypothetical protein